MKFCARRHARGALAAVMTALCTWAATAQATVLVVDRLSDSVYRYDNGGNFKGAVLSDSVNLDEPTGFALSPDLTKLVVSSSANKRVVMYDYDFATSTASNATIIYQAGTQEPYFPNAVLYRPDGSQFYVSNLAGTGVFRFNADGTFAGPAINGLVAGGSIFQYSGLAFAPGGELLVGGFQDFPAGTQGAVARSDSLVSFLTDFIGPSPSLNGAAGLLVDGNDLYVSGLFALNVQRFDATTGTVDPAFTLSGLAVPQSLAAAPGGNGFLVGILGFPAGSGLIAHYDFSGAPVGAGVFAASGGGGFAEATAFVVIVPEPAAASLAGSALAGLGFVVRGRRNS